MPAFNSEQSIEKSINSVLKQSYTNWELLIVNDGSTDNTVKIVEAYLKEDKRIRLFNVLNNQGIANARNIGIEEAKGEFLCFLDSDDMFCEDKLFIQTKYMEKNKVKFSFTDYYQINEKDEVINNIFYNKIQKINYNQLLKRNYIGCLTVMLDSKLAKQFKQKNIRHEDYDYWLSILKEEDYAYRIPKMLSYYRKTENSVSSNKFKSILWVWNVFRKGQKFPFFKTMNLFFFYLFNRVFN